jgi:cell wall-associated NlpC family hydrolase
LENSVVAVASSCVGTPYKFGGKSPKGFDCSGLVYYCYKSVGIKIPASTKMLRKSVKKVSRSLTFSNLRKGDILFFRIGKLFGKSNHVGIYIGNGMMIHASAKRGVVKEFLKNKYFKKRFTFAGRVLK